MVVQPVQVQAARVLPHNFMEYAHIEETADFLRSAGFDTPHTAIVLGTGLGKLISHIDVAVEIEYDKIPHFPVSTVEFHKGRLIFGTLSGKKIIAMQGRFHKYEGYDQTQITFPIRVFKALGAGQLILSNAAGAVNPEFKKGDLMLIDDHINLLGGSPLSGINDSQFGQRFVDMAAPYNIEMNQRLKALAGSMNINLNEGVYACVHGPHLETRAEYRFIRMAGADAVGMSTVPEAIVANQIDLPCAAISVLTDECDPDNLKPVDIADIIAAAEAAEPNLVKLIKNFLD